MRRDEQLSALMDDQLEADQLRFLLQGLKDDDEAREKWRRYHVIGEALRGAPARSLEADFSAAVMAEIESDSVSSNNNDGLSNEPAWVKRLVSFAVAASVATVAVFVANDRGAFEDSQTPAAIVASVPVEASLSNSANSSPVLQASTVASSVAQWSEVPSDIQQKLDRYLLNHAQSATGVPGQNMSQYIRLVGHRQQQDTATDIEVLKSETQRDDSNGIAKEGTNQ